MQHHRYWRHPKLKYRTSFTYKWPQTPKTTHRPTSSRQVSWTSTLGLRRQTQGQSDVTQHPFFPGKTKRQSEGASACPASHLCNVLNEVGLNIGINYVQILKQIGRMLLHSMIALTNTVALSSAVKQALLFTHGNMRQLISQTLERNGSTTCSIYLKDCKTSVYLGRHMRVHRSWALLYFTEHWFITHHIFTWPCSGISVF